MADNAEQEKGGYSIAKTIKDTRFFDTELLSCLDLTGLYSSFFFYPWAATYYTAQALYGNTSTEIPITTVLI